MSIKFRPTAVWRIRTSPGPGLPTLTSSHTRTSGPPVLWKRMACVMVITPKGHMCDETIESDEIRSGYESYATRQFIQFCGPARLTYASDRAPPADYHVTRMQQRPTIDACS